MSKIVPALSLVLSLAVAACTSANTALPTGCSVSVPDAGTTGATCAVAWSCNGDVEHFSIICDPAGANWSCTCATDTVATLGKTIVVNPFSCAHDNVGSAAAAECGWNLSE